MMVFSRTALCWISSYINGRRQKVISKSEGECDWLYTNVRVLQSLVLSPFLFSLYSNDLQHVLKDKGDDDPCKGKADKLQHLFYADDLQIYSRMRIDESGVAALMEVANRVHE